MFIPLFFLLCSYPFFLSKKYHNNTTKSILEDFFALPRFIDSDWDSGEVPWDIDMTDLNTTHTKPHHMTHLMIHEITKTLF